jgi:transposase InsO family protein
VAHGQRVCIRATCVRWRICPGSRWRCASSCRCAASTATSLCARAIFTERLALNDLEHRRTKVKHPYSNGFVERFHLTIKDEFFGVTLRQTLYESV